MEPDQDTIDLATHILDILGVSIEDGVAKCESYSYCRCNSPVRNPLPATPFSNLTPIELLSIESALNGDNPASFRMGALFDSIGWVLSNDTGKYRIYFIGSPTYDLWKEVLEEEPQSWRDDLYPQELDWYHGDNWIDGMDLSEAQEPVWKSDHEIPKLATELDIPDDIF